MTINELIHLIELEKKRIQESEFSYENEYLFFENFIKNNSFSSIEKLCKLDLVEFYIAYLSSKNSYLSFEEIKEKVKSCAEFIELTTTENYQKSLMHIEEMYSANYYQTMLELLEEKEELFRKPKTVSELISKKIINKDHKKKKLITDREIMKEHGFDILNMMELYMADSESIGLINAIIYTIKKIQEVRPKIQNNLEKIVEYNNLEVDGEISYHVNKGLRKGIALKRLLEEVQTIYDYYHKLESNRKNFNKEKSKSLKAYQKVASKLPKLINQKNKAITEYKQLIEDIPNKELRLEILGMILEHNGNYEKSLSEELSEYDTDSNKYKLLLQEKSLLEEPLTLAKIMCNELEDVKEIINLLNKKNISNKKIIIEILENSNLDIVKKIFELVEKGILSIEFILSNTYIFESESKEYKNLIENINFLMSKRINPTSFINSQKTLIIDSNLFEKNILILEKYYLSPNYHDKSKYSFLEYDKLEYLIDFILELDFEKYIEEDITLLNYDLTKWKRLRLLKELNIIIESKDELISILRTNNFIIPDEIIDEYLTYLEYTEEENKDILIELETKRTYQINGITLSKNRIKRNLENSKDIMFSIIKDSNLTEADYLKIKEKAKQINKNQ